MKIGILFFVVLIPCYLFSQINIVQNGDFETISGTIDCSYFQNAGVAPHNQEHLEDYWDQTPPWTVPYRNYGLVTVATSDHICPDGNFGPIYGQILNREYITQMTVSGLVPGNLYYIEFYVRKPVGGTLDNAGIKFSFVRPSQWGYHRLNIDNGQPDVEIDNSIVFPANTWIKYSTYYTPSQSAYWITFGTFGKEVEFEQLFQIDDIKVILWGENICPTVKLLENWNFAGLQGVYHQAGDNLNAGYDVGSPRANGDVIVAYDSEVRFKAGQEVGLFDGFSATAGSEFHAYNAPCGSECYPPSPVAGIATDICDGTPYEIGGPSGFSEFYAWTSSPSNATNYLSSTTISNPVFTPPSSGSGTITYTVTATNACAQTGSNTISIHYEDNPSSTVQLSLSNITLGDIPSFDVNYDSHVKSVTIEVLDLSLSTIYYSSTFLDALDFSCCSFPWELPVSLSPCIDYKVRVTATNYCTGAVISKIVDWYRNRTVTLTALLPNVVTPNGDGVNDRFCFEFTGASSYTLIVNPPSGPAVYIASNIVAYPVSACSWAGECNVVPTCSGGQVGDGVYYFTLILYGCDGQEAFSTAGYLELLNGSGRLANPHDSTLFVTENNSIVVFPNPTNDGRVNIDFGNQASQQVEVYNNSGQLMEVKKNWSTDKKQLVLSVMPAGSYFLKIVLADGKIEVKQIVVL
ncbi:hypothetical protein BH11BAC7_BH11BAC7_23220 [soil metagenome]